MLSSFPSISERLTKQTPRVTILAAATAVPPKSYTQSQTLEFVHENFQIQDQTKQLYQKTFSNKSIEKRHFALDELEEVLNQDHDTKNARYAKQAIDLSTRSLRKALRQSGVLPNELDFLAVATCTGYLCPGLSAYLVESCGLRTNIHTADLVGMGCGAAIPAMEQANNFLAAHPGATAAVVCTEVCTAAMVSTDDIDIVISNTIFADGSAALVLKSEATADNRASGLGGAQLVGFASRVVPEWRDTLRFKSEKGHLKNVLGRHVPEQAGLAVAQTTDELISAAGFTRADIDHWVVHAGGDKILNSVEKSLGLNPLALEASRQVLKNFGNMSSPTVLFVFEEEMKRGKFQPGDRAVMTSFGAGFSAHAALLEWI